MTQKIDQYGDYVTLLTDFSDEATREAEKLLKERIKAEFNNVIDNYLQTIVHNYTKDGKLIKKTVGVKIGVLMPQDKLVEETIVSDPDNYFLSGSIRGTRETCEELLTKIAEAWDGIKLSDEEVNLFDFLKDIEDETKD